MNTNFKNISDTEKLYIGCIIEERYGENLIERYWVSKIILDKKFNTMGTLHMVYFIENEMKVIIINFMILHSTLFLMPNSIIDNTYYTLS